MIKFIHEQSESDSPTFGDVDEDQFFVYSGRLYQKISDTSAQCICDENGCPNAAGDEFFTEGEEIGRILPKVSKIEF